MAGGLARTTSSTKCSQWASGPRTAVLGSFLFPSLGCFRGPLGCSLTPGAVPRWGQAGKAPRAHRMGEAASKAASGGLEGTAGPATALREALRPCGTHPAPGAPPGPAASAPGRLRQPPSWGCLRQRERRARHWERRAGPVTSSASVCWGGGGDGGWGVMVDSGGIASAGEAPGCSCFWASPGVCRQRCSALWVPQVPPAQGCFL